MFKKNRKFKRHVRKKIAEFFFIDNVSNDCFRENNKCNDNVALKSNNEFDEN